MVAIYPTALKTFSYRQDFTQIVEAADVNVAYDEIGAIQSTLGTTPQADTIDGKTVTWPTVKSSISAAKTGVTKPMVQVHAVDQQVPYSFNNTSFSPGGIFATYSYATWDTHNMWQGGNTLVCPRTGWYDFQVYTEWHLQTDPFDFEQPPLERTGYVELGIQINGAGRYVTGFNYQALQGSQFGIRESAARCFPWFQGDKVAVRLIQNVKTSSPLPCNVYFSVTYVRSDPTPNNM